MLHDILRGTVPNDTKIIAGSDPTILIKQGYRLDSKLANMKIVSNSKASTTWGFANLRPEGPRQVL
jgi:hypothetical protein